MTLPAHPVTSLAEALSPALHALTQRLRESVGQPRHGAILLPEEEDQPAILPWCSRCSGRTITLWRGPYPSWAMPVYEEDGAGMPRARPLSAAERADANLAGAYWSAADKWQSRPRPCEVALDGLPPLVWWQAADCDAHELERRTAYLDSVTLAAPRARRAARTQAGPAAGRRRM